MIPYLISQYKNVELIYLPSPTTDIFVKSVYIFVLFIYINMALLYIDYKGDYFMYQKSILHYWLPGVSNVFVQNL